jgi:glycosyltransferase involved in cell wall biosynthesis
LISGVKMQEREWDRERSRLHAVGPMAERPCRLSAILIVCNEAHRLEQCLRSVASIVDEIVVLDSGSVDNTVLIARSFGARTYVTDWPGFGAQKNRALDKATGEWILSIDADEQVTAELATSIRNVLEAPQTSANGWFIPFRATWCGKPVRFGAWAGKHHLRLFRREGARFTDDVIHERVVCAAPYGTLEGVIIHNTIASEREAFEKCNRYAILKAEGLRTHRGGYRPALVHAAWTFVRGFLLGGGFLDGVVGWKVARATTRGTWLSYVLAGRDAGSESRALARRGLWRPEEGPSEPDIADRTRHAVDNDEARSHLRRPLRTSPRTH